MDISNKKTAIQYRVPYADTDQMGVVYYANYLIYFERLRNELLRQSGTPYKIWEQRGIFLPVVESHCRYRNPAFYDDQLRIIGWVDSFGKTRIRIAYRVERGGKLLAEGSTVHACLNRHGRPVRLPPELIK